MIFPWLKSTWVFRAIVAVIVAASILLIRKDAKSDERRKFEAKDHENAADIHRLVIGRLRSGSDSGDGYRD